MVSVARGGVGSEGFGGSALVEGRRGGGLRVEREVVRSALQDGAGRGRLGDAAWLARGAELDLDRFGGAA